MAFFQQSTRKALFLDRDGTVIEDKHYLRDPNLIEFFPGVLAKLRELDQRGYDLYLISNQSGVGRGLISEDQFRAVHEAFKDQVERKGISFKDYLYCFHDPIVACACRKPKTGLIPKGLSLVGAVVIGDSLCDLELGDNLKATSILVRTGKGLQTERELPRPYLTFNSLVEASDYLLGHSKHSSF